MKFVKKILRGIFALWALLASIVSLIIVTPIYAIIFAFGGKNSWYLAHGLSRIWAAYHIIIMGVRLKVYGREKLNPKEAYVIISNHRSIIDIPLAACATEVYFKFLAKEELKKVPLWGYVIKNLYILVRRKSLTDRVRAMEKMKESLNEGISVWLFPEGTRNKTDQPLADFYDGAFQLAVATGKPLAVLTIIDTGKLLPSGELFSLRPGTVRAWWDGPIDTAGLTKKDVPALREKIRVMMLEHFSA